VEVIDARGVGVIETQIGVSEAENSSLRVVEEAVIDYPFVEEMGCPGDDVSYVVTDHLEAHRVELGS
jgi:hypothetical protein